MSITSSVQVMPYLVLVENSAQPLVSSYIEAGDLAVIRDP